MFEIPKDAGELAGLVTDTKAVWRPRQTRFAEDRRLFEVHRRRARPHNEATDADEVVTLNEARAQIQAGQAFLRDADPDVHLALDESRGPKAAQRLEYWCRDKRLQWEMQHSSAGLGKPLMQEETAYLLSVGWLTACVRWNNDPAAARFPFQCTLLDPAQVFPDPGSAQPEYYLHCSDMAVAQIEREWPRNYWDKAAKDFVGDEKATAERLRDRGRTVPVVQIYTDTHMACAVGGKGWIKKPYPHNYGINPIVCVLAHGAPWRTTDPVDVSPTEWTEARDMDVYPSARDPNEWTRYLGVGLADAIRHPLRDKEEVLSMHKLLHAKFAVPPAVGVVRDPHSAPQPPRDVGEVAWLELGESYQQLVPDAAALRTGEGLLATIQREIDTASIGPGAYGLGSAASGFQANTQADNATRPLTLYAEGYRLYLILVYRRFLRLFARFGQVPSPFVMPNQAGVQFFGPALNRTEAIGAEDGLTVQYKALTTADLMQRANAGSLLKREGIASTYWIQTELMGIANPLAEQQRMETERAMQHPAVQEWRMFRSLRDQAAQDQDVEQYGFAADMMEAVRQKARLQAQQAMLPPAPAGPPMPPGMGPAQPPLAGMGVDSAMLPDEMGPNAGAGPNGINLGPFQPGAAAQLLQ